MARLNPRVAAGVGVVAAFLLLGGPGAAEAIADRDGPRGDRGNSESDDGPRRDGSKGNDHERDDWRDSGNDRRQRPDSDAKRGIADAPQAIIGTGRQDQQRLATSDLVADSDSDSDSESGSGADGGGSGPSERSDATERSGSDRQGAANPRFDSPRVTIGNGRSPGLQKKDREPRWEAPAAEPAAPPPPPPPVAPPPPPPSWVDRIATPQIMTKQLGVAPAADWSDPLWGIAGLLLIPAAGAVLGYRQARASQAVDRLTRS